jgi:NADH-quinone oxidoreductase subunit N
MTEVATTINLALILPELILAVSAMALLMFGVYSGERSAPVVNVAAIGVLALATLAVLFVGEGGTTLSGAFIVDAFARFMKVAALIGSAVAIAMAWRFSRTEGFERFEFPILILLGTLGMLVMISANDLISLYLGLELQSLAAYVVAAFHRDDARSTEAGLKYFVLGALSSGMLLYGASLVYGFTGHTGFEPIAAALVDGRSTGLVIGLVFVLAGLAFKISAVPFHMWTPDVYEGAATPVTAFFASAPKLAAVALFIRVVIDAFAPSLHAARLLRRHRPAQHQAPDGLFLDRPHGIRPGRAGGRHASRRAGGDALPRHLHGDDARRLRLDHGDAAEWRGHRGH